MAFIFPALLIVVFLFCLAFLTPEGLWNNTVQLVNVLTAALLAINFWEPVAKLLDGFLPFFTYLWDIAVLWGIFGASLLLFQTITRNASAAKVRFAKIVEQIGSPLCAFLVGWVMVCFTTTTLHTAPLGERFLWGGFDHNSRMLFGLAPDRQFLGCVNFVSRGSLSCFVFEARPFDPDHKFMQNYALRRAAYEAHVASTRSFGVSDSSDSGNAKKR